MTDTSDSIGDGETVARASAPALPSSERFSPGDVLAERYRIVALLGKGGMGEVYRADDLKLGQQVALKFLPRHILHTDAIERLYGEVRLGRKISHPNVCRLYDIGEWRGSHFVTMEYIDGEDLASLLRRIGQLPHAKAVELAQDICAGLAAAHGLGVVHRDLKPANIMIDGRGNAIITDFGLAALGEDLEGRSDVAGTPAYMAPEQLRGGTVTHKSDLYALGLILYEMFTGNRKFEGRSIDEMRKLHESSDPSTLSRETKSIDPVIQQVVQRCLEPEPEDRPRSIHSIIAALPGADPLQAAIDAGETPSPEMVAAAGKSGELTAPSALGLAIIALVLLAGLVWLKERTELYGTVPLPKHPRVLEADAREILELSGFETPVRDSSYYLGPNEEYQSASPEERRAIDPATAPVPPLLFFYRQSPKELLPLRGYRGDHRITPYDPPLTLPGMASVTLTPDGRVVSLLVVPDETYIGTAAEPQWQLLLEAAGLDASAAREVDPLVPAPVDTDQRRSWQVPFAGQPEQVVRVDAAALGGRVVWFDVVPPWRKESLSDRQSISDVPSSPPNVVVTVLTIIVLASAIWFARRNLRRGRGDRRGAARLGMAILLGLSVSHLLRADLRGPLPHVWDVTTERVGLALFRALTIVILYLAVEPYLRRRWPTLLVSWSRLLSGRWRDPLVGRHILFGVVAGLLWSVIKQLAPMLGPEPMISAGAYQSVLTSARQALAVTIQQVMSGLFPAFILTVIMVGLSVVLHRRLAGAAAIWFLLSLVPILGASAAGRLSVVVVASVILSSLVTAAVIYRLGLLAALVSWSIGELAALPLTFDTHAFYFPSAALTFVFVLGFLAWGLFVSLGSRPQTVASLQSADSI